MDSKIKIHEPGPSRILELMKNEIEVVRNESSASVTSTGAANHVINYVGVTTLRSSYADWRRIGGCPFQHKKLEKIREHIWTQKILRQRFPP